MPCQLSKTVAQNEKSGHYYPGFPARGARGYHFGHCALLPITSKRHQSDITIYLICDSLFWADCATSEPAYCATICSSVFFAAAFWPCSS
ncbi:hypothetical protein SAMN05445850_2132 [Paraburkholderia tuberum]|uniref:Uncharacterized protein n=1 Tax=Paraburkholderia tuberum TaxID=157910 RepID=A0A1H1ET66_9BURK|nr:hypothetical protein SAMN05445850_2132 [Paraburkholderia tuberum]